MATALAELFSLMESRSAGELTQRTSQLSQDMGFEYFIYGSRLCDAQGRAVDTVLNGYPVNWRRAYEEQRYVQRDPTVRHALSSHLPLLWTAEFFASQSAADLHEHARQFGLRVGLTLPIRAADRSVGLLSLATADAKIGGDGAVEVLAQARLLADYLHEAAQRLLAPRTRLTEGLLSARECECLHWAAAGKTSWEIGRILSLSERTVNFHIGNAMRKLEVTTRGQALAKALALQLIRP